MVAFMTFEERQKIADKPRARLELPAPLFDGVAGGTVSLEQLREGLTVRIPYFAEQRIGARFFVFVGTEDPFGGWGGSGYIETSDSDSCALIPPEQAIDFRGQSLKLYFIYVDSEGSKSPVSEYFGQDEIYRPVVDEAVEGVIPLKALEGGVKVRLRASDALSAGALVSFYWHGTACAASLVRHFQVQSSDEGKDIVLAIDADFLKADRYGVAHLIYTVEKSDRKWTTSLVTLHVEGDLKPPVPKYGSSGFYKHGNLEQIDESGRIPFVLSTQGMSDGDALTFILSGQLIGTSYVLRQTLIPSQIGHDLTIHVPLRYEQLITEVTAMCIVERKAGDTIGSPVMLLAVHSSE